MAKRVQVRTSRKRIGSVLSFMSTGIATVVPDIQVPETVASSLLSNDYVKGSQLKVVKRADDRGATFHSLVNLDKYLHVGRF